PEAWVLRPADLDGLAADLSAAARGLHAEVRDGLQVVGREVPFVLALPHGAPYLFLHGRIDLVARRRGTLVVRDYKYARPADAAVAGSASQLAAYRLAVGRASEEAVAAELVFLRGGPVVRRVPALAVAE